MSDFTNSLIVLLSPLPFLLCVMGTVLGIIVGAIPGLTGAMLIALTLPLTFYMTDVNSMVLLVSMYVGAISGGLITATLLRMPGTPSSIMTTFDAYPMARSGQPGKALGYGITASFIGGLISWFFLVLLAEPMSEFAVRFGPFDYFALVVMALVLMAAVSVGSMAKGLLSGFLGMLVAFPGVDTSTGFVRLTFGFSSMEGGFGLLPVLVGIFAFNQVLSEVFGDRKKAAEVTASSRGILLRPGDLKGHWVNLVRSSVIGTCIGILPGIGANIGSVVSYTVGKTVSRNGSKYGTGVADGIIASEAANNATICGALVPLVAIGIPGSVIDAILISALVLHGIQPGPLLFVSNPGVVWSIITTSLIANIVMFVVLLVAAPFIVHVVRIPKSYMLPVIVMFCVIGTYANANRTFDVWTMICFGVIGFLLERARVPLAPFVIGFVLAPIAEEQLRTGLAISGGSLLPLVTQPFAALCMLASLVLFSLPLLMNRKARMPV